MTAIKNGQPVVAPPPAPPDDKKPSAFLDALEVVKDDPEAVERIKALGLRFNMREKNVEWLCLLLPLTGGDIRAKRIAERLDAIEAGIEALNARKPPAPAALQRIGPEVVLATVKTTWAPYVQVAFGAIITASVGFFLRVPHGLPLEQLVVGYGISFGLGVILASVKR